ncbi:hypothetical protein JTE90_028538 [Oedothorax gibbosus]|uniref:Uncharacterized protein n=1 Tax=Oedothorax gibbosus TaxID=931172 RepID=A0AAV6VX54_9ARAC|nr:hypothetical protein JTE90_028538 [Oedothorax gibbosus]
MCLMDVTTNLFPKWKMYNVPTERVVSYSILLKQNREFQQFINQLKSEVSNKVSCCILDKISVTLCEEELNIYIFDKSTDIKSGEAKVLPVPDQMLKLNSVTVKRKFNDIENNKRVKTLKVSHEIRKKFCDCHERNNWKVYKRITRQPVVNYIDLLKADFDFSTIEDSEFHSIPSEDFQIPESLHVHENIKKHLTSSEKLFSNLKSTENFDPSMNSCQFTKADLDVELVQTENVHNRKENDKSDEKYAPQINSNTTSNKPILDTLKNVSCKNNYDALEETELSSRSLKNALVVDEFKNIENTQTCMPLPNTTQVPVPVMGFQSCNKSVSIDKLSKGFQSISSCKASVAPKTFQSISTSNFPETVGFQTAAGKSLNISEKAILAAQKMFDEVCSQEINLFDKDEAASSSKAKKPVYPVENNIDNEFNSVFADKFFEEFPFDDKEGELQQKVDLLQPLPLKLDNKVSQVGKVRKSLGGRRSLKPYSVKR